MAQLPIVAIDPGSRKCGFAVVDPHRRHSGTWQLWRQKDKDAGLDDYLTRWQRLRSSLSELALHSSLANGVQAVALELVQFTGRGSKAGQGYGAARVLVSLWASDHGWPLIMIPPGTWKKHTCGNGAATKPAYIAEANRRFNLALRRTNEDEAAALLLGVTALETP